MPELVALLCTAFLVIGGGTALFVVLDFAVYFAGRQMKTPGLHPAQPGGGRRHPAARGPVAFRAAPAPPRNAWEDRVVW